MHYLQIVFPPSRDGNAFRLMLLGSSEKEAWLGQGKPRNDPHRVPHDDRAGSPSGRGRVSTVWDPGGGIADALARSIRQYRRRRRSTLRPSGPWRPGWVLPADTPSDGAARRMSDRQDFPRGRCALREALGRFPERYLSATVRRSLSCRRKILFRAGAYAVANRVITPMRAIPESNHNKSPALKPTTR